MPLDIKKEIEDPVALDEAIKNFRRTLKHCTNAECVLCHYFDLTNIEENCSIGLLDEFDNIIIRLKEEHHANT